MEKILFTPYYRENLILVAIDEAQSGWSYKLYIYFILYRGMGKFRKAYECIGGIRSITRAPFMVLTAPCYHDIHTSLSLISPVTIMHNVNRPNISLSVGKKSSVEAI